MSGRHAIHFTPEPVKPVRYRTHRTWWQRLRPVVVVLLYLAIFWLIALGVAGIAARVAATDAQLDAAYLRGMSAGQVMCRSN